MTGCNERSGAYRLAGTSRPSASAIERTWWGAPPQQMPMKPTPRSRAATAKSAISNRFEQVEKRIKRGRTRLGACVLTLLVGLLRSEPALPMSRYPRTDAQAAHYPERKRDPAHALRLWRSADAPSVVPGRRGQRLP